MRFLSIFQVLFSVFLSIAEGQEGNAASESAGDLLLRFRNINFVKNNEYSNPVIDGYTLIGYFLQPEMVFRPSEKVTLCGGVHLLGFSGAKRFSVVKPVFSTTYNFSARCRLTLGTLSGSDEHRMFDPHFNTERKYDSWLEDGIQFRFTGERVFSDTWLNWENYIFRGDNEREIFTAGESFMYQTRALAGFLRIEIPIQFQFRHYGGQITNYPEEVETYFNMATGARIILGSASDRYGATGIEYLFFSGSSLRKNAPSGIDSGHADWYRLFWKIKGASFEAGYWNAFDFYAPLGNNIFGSVSDHSEGLVLHDRKLITVSLNFRVFPENFLEIFFGLDGYYDTGLKRFDNALTLHMRFDRMFRLITLREGH